MGAAALPLIALAASTAATAYNTRQTMKKADAALASGIRKRAATQRRADAKIDQAITETGASRPDAASINQQYQQALQGTEQNARAGQTLSGLSKEYDAATTAATAGREASVSKVADLLSRIDAASQQREREGQARANLGSNLGVLERESQGQDFLAKLKAQSVRRNPWLDMFAKGLQAYATRGAGGSIGSSLGSVYGTPQTTDTGDMYRGYA